MSWEHPTWKQDVEMRRLRKKFRSGRSADQIDASSANGFTLIEVTVTLTILGFILLIIFGAFRLGLSAWEKGETTRGEFQRMRVISQLVSRQIKSVVPYKIKSSKSGGDYLAFEGKSRSLKFISALPLKAKQPEGFVYAIYQFQEGGKEGGRLVFYEQRVLNKDFFEETPKEELGVPLFEGISDIHFEYYREENLEKNQKGDWIEEWNGKEEKELPKALRMVITYKNEKEEKEEASFTLLASISANRYEEIRATPTVFGRRGIRERGMREGF
jgi:prepilin-type N-terminal cleavage/methylation domain-containing protein